MNNAKLAQATLLALTRHNVTQRKAPLSTYIVKAMCITRNIREGETVIVQKNNDGTINRLSDMLSYSGSEFFVDEKNRIYDKVSNNLRIRDGLSGIVLDQGQMAYVFKVGFGLLGYCVTQAADNNNRAIWEFVYEDGSVTKPIELPYTGTSDPIFGFRNGILAIASSAQGSNHYSWTYNKSGDLLYALNPAYGYRSTARWLVPISATSVGICVNSEVGGIFDQAYHDGYLVAHETYTEDFGHIYAVYHGYNAKQSSSGTWLGHDQTYVYLYHQLLDPNDVSVRLNEYVTCRISIDNFSGAETIERFEGSRTYSSTNNREHLAVRYGSHAYVIDRATMGQAFSGELDLASNTTINMMENDGYIWDSPLGIYQKTALGTVMWQSSIYPKTSPYGQLGYALYDVTVGSIGEAVVLFS